MHAWNLLSIRKVSKIQIECDQQQKKFIPQKKELLDRGHPCLMICQLHTFKCYKLQLFTSKHIILKVGLNNPFFTLKSSTN